MYIQLDADFWDHPKTLDLVASIGPGADVYPPRLWTWAAKYAPSGELESVARVESACRWTGERGVLCNALLAAGFIDEGMQLDAACPRFFLIHGWEDRTGKAIAAYEQKKERMRKPSGNLPEAFRHSAPIEESRVEESRVEEIRGEEDYTPPTPLRGGRAPASEVLAVTEALVAIWNAGRTPQTSIRVTKGRKAKVAARLADGFTREQLEAVTRSLLASAFHTGTNDRGWSAPGPEWVLSSTEKVEQWLNGNGSRGTRRSPVVVRAACPATCPECRGRGTVVAGTGAVQTCPYGTRNPLAPGL